jgi:ADP-heptose:LPS heptosyltransferase
MKLLVVRFSSIGDIVLTTPVIRCIRQQTNATIHFVTKKNFAPILDVNPNLDKLFLIEKQIDEVIGDLKKEKYDYVIDLHNNVRTASLKRKLGVKSFSFPKENIKKLLLTVFKIDRMPKLHLVDRYFETVKSINVYNDHKPCDFFIGDENSVNLNEFSLVPHNFLTVAVGAQFATKQIPIKLLRSILEEIAVPIVLLGGQMDIERSKELQESLPSRLFIDFCGKLSLNQSASVVSRAKALLTGDTGLMHIASCFEVPIVSVWGNTVPSLGMFPYTPQSKSLFSIHEVKGLKCRPCSKIGYQKCPKNHFDCMTKQNTPEITKSLNHYLKTD